MPDQWMPGAYAQGPKVVDQGGRQQPPGNQGGLVGYGGQFNSGVQGPANTWQPQGQAPWSGGAIGPNQQTMVPGKVPTSIDGSKGGYDSLSSYLAAQGLDDYGRPLSQGGPSGSLSAGAQSGYALSGQYDKGNNYGQASSFDFTGAKDSKGNWILPNGGYNQGVDPGQASINSALTRANTPGSLGIGTTGVSSNLFNAGGMSAGPQAGAFKPAWGTPNQQTVVGGPGGMSTSGGYGGGYGGGGAGYPGGGGGGAGGWSPYPGGGGAGGSGGVAREPYPTRTAPNGPDDLTKANLAIQDQANSRESAGLEEAMAKRGLNQSGAVTSAMGNLSLQQGLARNQLLGQGSRDARDYNLATYGQDQTGWGQKQGANQFDANNALNWFNANTNAMNEQQRNAILSLQAARGGEMGGMMLL